MKPTVSACEPTQALSNGQQVLRLLRDWRFLVVLGVSSLLGPSVIQAIRYECSPQMRVIRGAVGSTVLFHEEASLAPRTNWVRAKLDYVGYEVNDSLGFFALRVGVSGETAEGMHFETRTVLSPGQLWRIRLPGSDG